MKITATQGKNRFGDCLGHAGREPVEVSKNGRVAAVTVSAARHAQLQALERTTALDARRRAFRSQYKHWIDEQNRHNEAHGLWCEGLVAWPQD